MEQNNNKPNYKIPEKFKRSLKKGEFAMYRMLGVTFGTNEKGEVTITGRDLILPNVDVIQDSESGDLIPIAYVKSWKANGDPNIGEIMFYAENQCQFTLRHGARDAAAYQFLEICNYNISNPDRDPNAEPAFEKIDTMSGAKDSRAERANKKRAMDIAASLTDEELIEFMNANQVKLERLTITYKPDGTVDFEALRDGVEHLAETRHAKFLNMDAGATKPVAGIDQIIDKAIEADVLGFDKETKSWYNKATSKTILQVLSIKFGTPKKELSKWLQSPAGKSVLAILTEAATPELSAAA